MSKKKGFQGYLVSFSGDVAQLKRPNGSCKKGRVVDGKIIWQYSFDIPREVSDWILSEYVPVVTE